ncbi:hypothetical protein ABAC402_12285 [Asticcacaulis sp. AC402]|nr:hypothetical protein ABAC402_12285 [Asticcacaulis sp. AC402]
MDKDGNVGFALKVSGMYRGNVSSETTAKTEIYADA